MLKYKKVEKEMEGNTEKTYVLADGPFTLVDVIAKNPPISILWFLVDDMDTYNAPCTYEFEDEDIEKYDVFDDEHGWFIENGFIKEKEKLVLKIGDFVLVNGDEGYVKFDNEVGRVVRNENSDSPGVEFFSKKVGFHDVFGALDSCTGYFVSKDLIVKVLSRL